jgi:plastocyanin
MRTMASRWGIVALCVSMGASVVEAQTPGSSKAKGAAEPKASSAAQATKAGRGGRAIRSKDQVVTVAVTSEGFVPARIKTKVGTTLKLLVTRKTDQTCATSIVIKDHGIDAKLPLNTPVEVRLTAMKPGELQYACPMDMIVGTISVE